MTLEHIRPMLEEALRKAGQPEARYASASTAELELHGLTVGCEYREGIDSLVLYCSLGTLPFEPAPSLLEYLLECNLLGKGSGGGHIGLHPQTRILVFSLALPAAQLDSSRLANVFDRFAEKAAELITETEARSYSPLAPSPFMGNVLWA